MFFLLLPYIFTNIIERYNQNIIKKKVVVNKSFIYADFNGSDISFIDSLKTFTFAILIPIDKILNVEKFDEILIDVEEVIEKRNCGYLIRGFIEKEEAINAIDKLIINNIVKNDVYDILTPKLVIND